MRKQGFIAAVLAAALVVTGCSSTDEPTDDHPMHEHYHGDEGGTTDQRPEDAMPYGEHYRELSNQPPEVVVTTALTRLAEATSAEVDTGTAVDRLNGVTTPALWSTITADPSLVVPTMPGPMWREWDEAGGTQTATVQQDGEQHPPDTDTTWARKFAVTRSPDGQVIELHDSYVVECTNISGQWRISDLRLLSTTATTPTPTVVATDIKADLG